MAPPKSYVTINIILNKKIGLRSTCCYRQCIHFNITCYLQFFGRPGCTYSHILRENELITETNNKYESKNFRFHNKSFLYKIPLLFSSYILHLTSHISPFNQFRKKKV